MYEQVAKDIDAIKNDVSKLRSDVKDIKVSIAGNKELGVDGVLDKFHQHKMQYTMDKMEVESSLRSLQSRATRIEKRNFKHSVVASTISTIFGMGIGAWIKAKFM